MEVEERRDTTERHSAATLLKWAYLILEEGRFEEALQACDQAAAVATEEQEQLLARALGGAIYSAQGRPQEALRVLMGLHRRHQRSAPVALYLAEACFLAGRHRRGWKVLESIEEQLEPAGPWASLAAQLRETWQLLEQSQGSPSPNEDGAQQEGG